MFNVDAFSLTGFKDRVSSLFKTPCAKDNSLATCNSPFGYQEYPCVPDLNGIAEIHKTFIK